MHSEVINGINLGHSGSRMTKTFALDIIHRKSVENKRVGYASEKHLFKA